MCPQKCLLPFICFIWILAWMHGFFTLNKCVCHSFSPHLNLSEASAKICRSLPPCLVGPIKAEGVLDYPLGSEPSQREAENQCSFHIAVCWSVANVGPELCLQSEWLSFQSCQIKYSATTNVSPLMWLEGKNLESVSKLLTSCAVVESIAPIRQLYQLLCLLIDFLSACFWAFSTAAVL